MRLMGTSWAAAKGSRAPGAGQFDVGPLSVARRPLASTRCCCTAFRSRPCWRASLGKPSKKPAGLDAARVRNAVVTLGNTAHGIDSRDRVVAQQTGDQDPG